ncbi:FkbM family methyltransferase [Pectobacterium versatile]|uniref:FkbM family methyltransferase n=1 Tax=Pectobacterium versatile TaxID=2488639 RepID=UPI000F8D4542|nr:MULTISPECIES: FkbM family methyltransferase [Pectobacterium]MBA0183345.1 FkbM family methyltransferase [Pectobacterium versatile]MCA5931085.1 FkbM family methyltransferase [Pectobacterium versatile]MCA5948281.1 FkbM family methyltransferase [Pectobacterium versatile]MCA5952380.1 FkbM family methyltransferase [Pectobacterium versatile]MCL6375022.1 FkbM family methyltransferase [Pectobacterium atrosepticum]
MNRIEHAINFCRAAVERKNPVFIFGTSQQGISISYKIPIDGFIDDFSSLDHINNIPIFKIDDIPNNALVICAVVQAKIIMACKKLEDRNLEYLDYYYFRKYSGLELPSFMFLDDFSEEYDKNSERYKKIRELLSDEESKRVFDNLINFRLTHDISFMKDFSFCPKKQYFDEVVFCSNYPETFVDAGSYDGSTTLEFINKFPDYKSIYVFEPERKQFNVVKDNLKGIRNIYFFSYGLSEKEEELRFELNGTASKVSDEGEGIIQVCTLDQVLSDTVSYIKMDIEGYEINALKGAKETILRFHPKLAICAYHKVDDFFTIPELVLSYRNDYKVYMRHYTEGLLETVYYFIPK